MLMVYNGEKLAKELRTKRLIEMDMTLRDVANELGIGYSTISRIENKKKPDIETMATVCNWINQPMNAFFTKPQPIKKSKK
jgi:transcriptional regulator with XRE-family HTH domain